MEDLYKWQKCKGNLVDRASCQRAFILITQQKKSSGATQILCSISCNWDESSSVEKWLGAVDFLYEIQTVEFMWVWQQQWSCSFVKAKTLLPCFGILLSLSVGLLWYDYRAN